MIREKRYVSRIALPYSSSLKRGFSLAHFYCRRTCWRRCRRIKWPQRKIPARRNRNPQNPTPTTWPEWTWARSAQQKPAPVHDMTPGGHDAHSLHMYMTAPRPQTPEDIQRAQRNRRRNFAAASKNTSDYHVALDDGFRIFLPNIPQPEYHFTKLQEWIPRSVQFRPARPTSLLYKKTATGYELVGAMYTMPKRASEDQLNARVPAQHRQLAPAHQFLPAAARPTPHRRLHEIRLQGFHRHAGRLRRRRRPLPAQHLWLDGARLPLRRRPGQIFAMHHHMD